MRGLCDGALRATRALEPAIVLAPISARSTNPNAGVCTPAAIGNATSAMTAGYDQLVEDPAAG